MTRLILAAAAALALAGCAGGASTVATDTTVAASTLTTAEADANAALTVAEATLTAYEATKNPSPVVVAEAKKLDAEARAALNQYGPEASEALAAGSALVQYLLTSAPGNGTTPSTVPTS
jgi:ABC-type enterochelin transport system substrate-binding protein